MGIKMKIMLVEDDEALAGEISSFLIKWGFDTEISRKYDEILQEFMEWKPQLVPSNQEDFRGANYLYKQPRR